VRVPEDLKSPVPPPVLLKVPLGEEFDRERCLIQAHRGKVLRAARGRVRSRMLSRQYGLQNSRNFVLPVSVERMAEAYWNGWAGLEYSAQTVRRTEKAHLKMQMGGRMLTRIVGGEHLPGEAWMVREQKETSQGFAEKKQAPAERPESLERAMKKSRKAPERGVPLLL